MLSLCGRPGVLPLVNEDEDVVPALDSPISPVGDIKIAATVQSSNSSSTISRQVSEARSHGKRWWNSIIACSLTYVYPKSDTDDE